MAAAPRSSRGVLELVDALIGSHPFLWLVASYFALVDAVALIVKVIL